MFRFKLLSALFLILAPVCAAAQLENSVWVFPKTNLLRFDSTGVIEMEALDGPNDYNWMPASICDSAGNLVAYIQQTEGTNKTPYKEKTELFNPSRQSVSKDMYIGNTSAIILPKTDNSHEYLILTFNRENRGDIFHEELVYHTYNPFIQNQNGTLGSITSTNQPIIKVESQDFEFSSDIGICKNSSNSGWWIIVKSRRRHLFYSVLYENNSFKFSNPNDFEIDIHEPFNLELRNFSFNSIGNKLLSTYSRDGVYLFDFNRCNGRLMNPMKIHSFERNPNIEFGIGATSCFSVSGKYIYILHLRRLLRLELEKLSAVPDTIAVFNDTLIYPLSMGAHDMRLAPDGRIYITVTPWDLNDGLSHEWPGVSDYLAVVREPDSADCQFEFHGLKLPNHTTAMLPRQAPFEMPPLTFADLPEVPDDTLRRCYGGPPVALHPAGMRYENVSYRWEPAASLDDPNTHNPTAAPETTTTYTLFLEGMPESCWPGDTLTRTVTVAVARPPQLLTEAETAVCPGETLLLQADADTGWACRWEPATALADPAACQTLARPQTTTTYTLTAEQEHCGGFFQAEVAVVVKTCGLPPLPTVFSPNGDGINDAWPAFQHADFVSYSLKIYDRWGRELFSTQNPLDGWDGSANGTPAPEGVYFYRLDAATAEGAEIRKSGSLTVVR